MQYHTASADGRGGAAGCRPASTDQPVTRTASLARARPASAAAAPAPRQVQTRSGWFIQVGAFPAETEARERLQSAQSAAKDLLGKAEPFTERVMKGNDTLFRARFAGLDETRAEAACRHLKRNKIDCFAVRN